MLLIGLSNEERINTGNNCTLNYCWFNLFIRPTRVPKIWIIKEEKKMGAVAGWTEENRDRDLNSEYYTKKLQGHCIRQPVRVRMYVHTPRENRPNKPRVFQSRKSVKDSRAHIKLDSVEYFRIRGNLAVVLLWWRKGWEEGVWYIHASMTVFAVRRT